MSCSSSGARPSANACSRYAATISALCSMCEYTGETSSIASVAPVRDRARLEAMRDSRSGPFEVVDGRGPHHPQAFRVRGHDVGRVTAAGHDAVDLIAGLQVLAEEPDRDLCDGHRIARVDAQLGSRRRVGARPVYETPKCATALTRGVRSSSGAGCTIIAAFTPANAPRSSKKTLPPPPSSAGVPITLTHKSRSSTSGASASAAPTAVAAMMLCPHVWPMPGSASYSAQIARWSEPVPIRHENAVGRSQIPASTDSPASESNPAVHALERVSSNFSSGFVVHAVTEVDQGALVRVDGVTCRLLGIGSSAGHTGSVAPCSMSTQ